MQQIPNTGILLPPKKYLIFPTAFSCLFLSSFQRNFPYCVRYILTSLLDTGHWSFLCLPGRAFLCTQTLRTPFFPYNTSHSWTTVRNKDPRFVRVIFEPLLHSYVAWLPGGIFVKRVSNSNRERGLIVDWSKTNTCHGGVLGFYKNITWKNRKINKSNLLFLMWRSMISTLNTSSGLVFFLLPGYFSKRPHEHTIILAFSLPPPASLEKASAYGYSSTHSRFPPPLSTFYRGGGERRPWMSEGSICFDLKTRFRQKDRVLPQSKTIKKFRMVPTSFYFFNIYIYI